MALSSGYLTPKQTRIWDLKRRGFQEAGIARELSVTRQTVHKAVNTANDRISQALSETARLNRISVKTIDPVRGILLGYSQEFQTSTIVTFSARNGVQLWYKHEGDCGSCDRVPACRKTLLTEMEDRDIKPFPDSDTLQPSRLAEKLFEEITRR